MSDALDHVSLRAVKLLRAVQKAHGCIVMAKMQLCAEQEMCFTGHLDCTENSTLQLC